MSDGRPAQTLSDLLQQFSAWDEERRSVEEFRSRVTTPLYHYCDMSSLVGIVTSRSLWLSSIWHLNDPSELKFGFQLARNCALERFTELPDSTIDRFCWMIAEQFESGALADAFGFFVGSFSGTADDLAQWRAYADDARGVAIEIAPDWFQSDANKTWIDGRSDPRDFFVVSNVLYDEGQAKQRQAEAIDQAFRVYRSAEELGLHENRDAFEKFASALLASLGVPLLWNSLVVKHRAYAHEVETRLLLTHSTHNISSHVKTRTRGSQIISYVPVKFELTEPRVLRKILIGPAAVGNAERGIADLLRANGIDPAGKIERSTIPYSPR